MTRKRKIDEYLGSDHKIYMTDEIHTDGKIIYTTKKSEKQYKIQSYMRIYKRDGHKLFDGFLQRDEEEEDDGEEGNNYIEKRIENRNLRLPQSIVKKSDRETVRYQAKIECIALEKMAKRKNSYGFFITALNKRLRPIDAEETRFVTIAPAKLPETRDEVAEAKTIYPDIKFSSMTSTEILGIQ